MAERFEAFYRSTVQRTFDLMRRAAAGDKHLAEDSMQEAYVVVWSRWGDRASRTVEDNRRYLVGIAMHKLADWYRRHDRFREFEPEHHDDVDDRSVDAVVDERALMQAVRTVLVGQPDRRRLVGTLYFLENYSYDEIALTLDIDVSTVRTQVQRLRAVLRPYADAARALGGGGARS
jgi:RNA polymerase sigma factor (sigma-70 family)